MLATSRFTVGSVLEEPANAEDAPEIAGHPGPDPASAFNDGLAQRG
ncbi:MULTISPECIES: hypothetical protein [Amycolatopsis]|uniref:Uncharacterized protein n=1 Tax=Amycolatopsis albidoflavus TaxID=102226 RepID=A0ABW5IA46_9PSEU